MRRSLRTRGGKWISFPDGTFQWTTPAGRQYAAEPTRYPI